MPLFAVYLLAVVALGASVFVLRKTRLVNFVLLIFSVALCLVVLEGYYRFIYAESSGFGPMGGQNFNQRYYHLDAFGFRDSGLPPTETRPNIVVLGDSFTFGAGLKSPDERFSNQLRSQYPNLNVINVARLGWDTTHEIEGLTAALGATRAKVPLIILGYFYNDIGGDITQADRERVKPSVPPVEPGAIDHGLQWASRYSRFIELYYFRFGYPRLVRQLLEQMRMFYDDPEIADRHIATLERLRALAAERYGARLVIVTIPYLHSDPLLNDAAFYQRFHARLAARGLESIDMQPVFARHGVRKLRVSAFDPHTNPFAHRLIAETITAELGKDLAALR